MSKYDEWRRDLIERTHRHWENGSALSATEEYIRGLLPEELKYAQQCLNLKQRDDCDTLVLLLGFSTDPLLQSIWVYQPRRIVLICNEKYVFGDEDDPGDILTGRQWADHFRRYILQLQKQGLYSVPTLPNFDSANGASSGNGDIAICDKDASPDWVFRQLCERIIPQRRQASDEERKKKVVVDITGAKKNIMAGAFLFADYAGSKINYVDFDEYDARRHRPYGFTCRIGEQPNPYRMLSLRDWTRVRNLYEHFFFHAATEEVVAIEQRMSAGIELGDKQVRYFDDQQRAAVKVLGRVSQMLELWDNGDYTAAWESWSQVTQVDTETLPPLAHEAPTLVLPTAVKLLGSAKWPSSKTTNAQALYTEHRNFKLGFFLTNDPPDKSIFERVDLLLCYAGDEMAKVQRLIDYNEDCRSAFLRATALDEFLLKARIALLWLHDQLLIDGQPKSSPLSSAHQKSFVYLGNASSADGFRKFLLNPAETLSVGFGSSRNKLQRRSDISETWQLDQYWQHIPELDHETMVDLRGEAIHTHLSLPPEIAHAAYQIAEAGLHDFVKNWVNKLEPKQELTLPWSLSWEALCQACSITFLPPTPEEEAQ